MSFSFNGPSFRPMIQEAQSMMNDGGGGNTGYFQRGRKKKKEEKIDVFSEKESDQFTPQSDAESAIIPPTENKGKTILNSIIEKTKNVVKQAQTDIRIKTNNPFEQMSED